MRVPTVLAPGGPLAWLPSQSTAPIVRRDDGWRTFAT